MSEPLNILLCEPAAADADRVVRHLTSHGTYGAVTIVAATHEVPAAMTTRRWDLVLCAHTPSSFEARQVLDIVRAADPDVPIVVLAGAITEADCAVLFIAGARDVVRKADLARLTPVIAREIETTHIRRTLTQAVGRAELHFRNIVESSLQGIIIRANSKTQFVNAAFCKMFGYTHDDMMALASMTELHPASERERIQSHVVSRYSGDMNVYEYEVEGVRKDGSTFWCSKMASHVEWGGQLAVQVIVIDITERKKAEQQIVERERNYRETFENAPIAMIRSKYDREIIEMNKAFADMLGYSREELIGLRAGDLVPLEDRPSVIPQIKRVWDRELDGVDCEHRMIRKDGRIISVLSSCRLTEGDGSDAHPIQMLTQFQDITGRREAEIALKEREAQYRSLVERSLQGFLVVDKDAKPIFVNTVFAEMLGYSTDEILALETGVGLYHPEDRAQLHQRMASRRAGDNSPARYELRAVRKDGTLVWLEFLTSTVDWFGRRAVQVVSIDITERKMAAQLLEQRELKYRQMFEHAPVAMFRIDQDRVLRDTNRAFIDLVGYSKDELFGKQTYKLIHPEDWKIVRGRTSRVWSGDIQRVDNEYRLLCKDGKTVWVLSSGQLTPDENGELKHLLVQLQDITERKNAEARLRETQNSLALSEKQYRELFDNAPVAMCWVGLNGRYVRTNRAAQALLGYSAEELQQMHPLAALRPDHRERARTGFEAMVRGERDDLFAESAHIRKDGREIWVAATVRLTRDENGAPSHILAQLQDVTDRKLAEEQRDQALRSLARNERQYRELFEHAPVAVSALSPTGAFLQTNQAFRNMLGYSEDEILHMHAVDMVETGQREMARDILVDAARRTSPGGRVNHDLQLIRKDGVPIWVWMSATLVFDDDGKLSYILSHLQDISDRKRAEAQLFQSQKMEALGNLAGGIAHDFNNMLQPIIALTALTKEDLPPDSPLQENLDTVIEAAEKARRIVAQILTFSRQDQAPSAPIQISHCISEAAILVRNILPSSITIIDEVDADVGTVLADGAQLHSVILNLGSNAAHAMRGKTGEMAIGLTAVAADAALADAVRGLRPGGAYARIHVRDTGCGMDKDTLAKIFNPFFTTKPVGEGTGLGLSMVHGIVERFDGAIHVTSEVDVGTRFELYLPLHDEEQARAAHQDHAHDQAALALN